MTRDEIRTAILDAISGIAPEANLSSLDAAADLREQVDLDSFDFLNLMIAVHQRLGVEVPERDYAQLSTLERAVDYVATHVGGSGKQI